MEVEEDKKQERRERENTIQIARTKWDGVKEWGKEGGKGDEEK